MRVVVALSFLLAAGNLIAQTDTGTHTLNEVVVTAQRLGQKNIEVPYSVEKVSSQHLQRYNPRTTAEALQGINGVFVQKTNHGGGSPFIRGLTGNQTLMLVDGIRFNNSTFRYGPNQYLATIDPFIVQNIEVVKGTGSVQYGTDALGGVINVQTTTVNFAKKKPVWSGRVVGRIMNRDMEQTGRTEVAYATKKMVLSGGITYRNFGDLYGGDTTGRQTPSGYDQLGINAKATFLLSENTTLTLVHQSDVQQQVPVYHKVVLENFALNKFEPQKRQLQYARLATTTSNPLFSTIEITALRQYNTEGRLSRKNGSTLLRSERDKINTVGFTANVTSNYGRLFTANSGIELYHDKVNSARSDINTITNIASNKRGLYPNGATYGNYSLYTLHHVQLGKWGFDGGARFNTFAIRLTDTSLGKVSIRPSALVWNAAASYAITINSRLYVNYSTGFRAPNIDDMGTLGIVDFRYEVPAYNLKPEQSGNVEVGFKYDARRFWGNIALYQMQLTNLITRIKMEGQVIGGYSVYQKENVEDGIIKGAELALGWQPLKALLFTGNINYTYGQNNTKNEPIRRIPPFNGRVMATWQNKSWYATAETLFAGKQDRLSAGDKDDNRIPKGGTPGWQVVNVFAGKQFKAINISTGLQNILNVDYRTHGSGINGVGRSGWLTVSYRW